ncbi:DUF4160 domain-containing protein [Roseomonas sp. NAR14]|uniref:DUF4160 domain-containing protein n=1 Tax=Roseomonas acroporae TaxID=2937791 RepID=A0A9X1YDZ0_9PROT|nr:DUF4160 domain-containing protein [Roseomonas acroporae]MCK8787990.1 DUF4160 domain-containing protein [Roseomonas acroporae]
MPTVAIVAGVLIVLYFNDHDPAHFHAICGRDKMLVRISDLAVIRGDLPRDKRRAVLEWAAAKQADLALAWVRVRQDENPGRLD